MNSWKKNVNYKINFQNHNRFSCRITKQIWQLDGCYTWKLRNLEIGNRAQIEYFLTKFSSRQLRNSTKFEESDGKLTDWGRDSEVCLWLVATGNLEIGTFLTGSSRNGGSSRMQPPGRTSNASEAVSNQFTQERTGPNFSIGSDESSYKETTSNPCKHSVTRNLVKK